ncbi:MAG: TIGR03087 family PEP-CTERM/XrtA system glycosyltransferase [Gemmataceae bacterium]
MRILFLAQRVPFPPNCGVKIPTYHYIRRLAHDHDVTVMCLANGRADLANAPGLATWAKDVEAVPLSRTSKLRALAALAGTRPLTVAAFDEPELRRRVHRRIKAGEFDLAFVFSSGMASFVEPFADLPRVIQFADLDSLKWRQYAATSRPPMRWVYATEAERILAYERQIATTFTRSLVCSPRECDDFKRLIPDATVECLPNGVDLEYFRPAPPAAKRPDSLVFTGVMNYKPNVDGMVWFCREILPQVRAEVPGATLTICGSSPDKTVLALGKEPGVTVTGAVPDVRPYLDEASAAVVPLRLARGIQNKLLEAMAAGLPCVATTAAWAGIEAERGRDLLVADEPAAFAAAVVRLLRDRQLREQIGAAGRAAVEAGYRWERTLTRLAAVVEEAAVSGACERPGRGENQGVHTPRSPVGA